MADGYELDYKKVHNTLGEPNDNKYGEEIGQYVTNLWPQKRNSLIGSTYQIEGILIENSETYQCSNNYLYGNSYLPSSIFFSTGYYDIKVFLPDLKKTVPGRYRVITAGSNTSIIVSKTVLPAGLGNVHFKVVEIQSGPFLTISYDPLTFFDYYVSQNILSFQSTYWRSEPIPLTENLIYNLTNENKENIYYYIFGYDSDRDEYVWITDSTNYRGYWSDNNVVFRCPDIGLIHTQTQTISGFSIRIDQWYIVFYRKSSANFIYNHFFFGSSIPLVISQTGQIIKNTYSNDVIRTLPKYTTDMYSDTEAFNLLKNYPPVVEFDGNTPESLSINEELQEDTDFLNWLSYKNYNLVLVTVRDHYGAKETHQYEHNDESFTVENKRYGILRYIYSDDLHLPTYEWTPSTINNVIYFDSLDSDKTTIQSRRINIGWGSWYTCTVEQIPNQCQLSKWDSMDGEENYETHICFALAVIRKNSRHIANNTITDSEPHYIFNGSHISINDIPSNDFYYNDNRCTLRKI